MVYKRHNCSNLFRRPIFFWLIFFRRKLTSKSHSSFFFFFCFIFFLVLLHLKFHYFYSPSFHIWIYPLIRIFIIDFIRFRPSNFINISCVAPKDYRIIILIPFKIIYSRIIRQFYCTKRFEFLDVSITIHFKEKDISCLGSCAAYL